MRPYFSVGEEVILCSVHSPELNGEYEVIEFEWRTGAINYLGYYIPEGFRYRLSIDHKCQWWHEIALRKKHKTADKSFQELIKSTRELKV